MSCQACQHFTAMERQDDMGYCDWLRSEEAELQKMPMAVRRIRVAGITVSRKDGDGCQTFQQRSRT